MNGDLPIVFWFDLFCGAGGTTTGIHLADANAKVVACVNHDQIAIQSHKANHPNCLHLTEDIRDFKVIEHLKNLAEKLRKQHPNCIINIWASLECTNYSKAKGGLPRDADSRTLAEHLIFYLKEINPDYLYIENVREFMSWGPLDKYGRPISRKNGTDYVRWCNEIISMGYNYDFKLLNAADYGAYTSRTRYFGVFSQKGMPISFPKPTHVKSISEDQGMFDNKLKKWKPVKDVLKLDDHGQSIFTRKKPLSENTLKRIYAGLLKFVAGGEDKFTKVYNSGNDLQRVKSIHEPIGSVTTGNSHAVVSTQFLYHNHGGQPSSKVWPIDKPNRTVTGNHYKIKTEFLTSYYGNSLNAQDVEKPSPTITTKDRISKIHPQFFMHQYSGGGQSSSIEKPHPTVTIIPKSNLISAKKWLVDHQYSNKGKSIEESAPTIIARQDKKPLYIIHCDVANPVTIAVFDDDNETMIKIKEFMVLYGIVDIKMRMLLVDELKAIQGFPKDYILKGTKTDQKRFIGNSVETTVARRLVEANYKSILKIFKQAS